MWNVDLVYIEIITLLGYYTAESGNFLPAFQDNLLVPSCWPLKMGPIGCPKFSVRNCHSMLHDTPEECRSHLYCSRSLKSCIVMYCQIVLQKEEEEQRTWPVLHDDFMIGTARLKDWDKIDSPTWRLWLHCCSWYSYVLEGGRFFLFAINVTETVHLQYQDWLRTSVSMYSSHVQLL